MTEPRKGQKLERGNETDSQRSPLAFISFSSAQELGGNVHCVGQRLAIANPHRAAVEILSKHEINEHVIGSMEREKDSQQDPICACW